MSGPSVLESIDEKIFDPLSRCTVECDHDATGIENSAEALGLLCQLCIFYWYF